MRYHFMGKVTTSTPLLFKSKLLCFSLFYLFTALFLALYTSLSQSKCLFRSSPFDPLQTPLFSYPSSYGEHKYALPTHRSTCSSPVFFTGTCPAFFFFLNFCIQWLSFLLWGNGFWFLFSDYWTVLKEIRHLCRNSSLASPVLSYMQGQADSFGGNFTTQKRISYFDHENSTVEVPCGFLKKFPISNYG